MPDRATRVRELLGQGLGVDEVVRRVRQEEWETSIAGMPDDEMRAAYESLAGFKQLGRMIKGVPRWFLQGAHGIHETVYGALEGLSRFGQEVRPPHGMGTPAQEEEMRAAYESAKGLGGLAGSDPERWERKRQESAEKVGLPRNAAELGFRIGGMLVPYFALGRFASARLGPQIAAGMALDIPVAMGKREYSLAGIAADMSDPLRDVPTERIAPFEDQREEEFQGWYADRARTLDLDPDPDSQSYDYRRAWEAGAEPDEDGHWPSDFKLRYHPNLIVDGQVTATGEDARGSRFHRAAEYVADDFLLRGLAEGVAGGTITAALLKGIPALRSLRSPAVRAFGGAAAGGVIGGMVNEDNRMAGITGGALLGMGAAMTPELVRAAGGQYATPLPEGARATRGAVVNPVAPRVAGETDTGMRGRWYSRLNRAIEQAPQDQMPASQWMGSLRNTKEGLSGTEVEWTKIEELLAERGDEMLTRGQVMELAQRNPIRLTETVRGRAAVSEGLNMNSPYMTPRVREILMENQGEADDALRMTLENDGAAYRELTAKFPELAENEDWADVVLRDVVGTAEDPQLVAPKYPGITLGARGKEPDANYREILIRLDDQRGPSAKLAKDGDLWGVKDQNTGEWLMRAESYPVASMYVDRLDQEAGRRAGRFTGGHWSEPNVLSSLRVTDEVGEGSEKILRVREMQDDWAQQLRAGRDVPDRPFKKSSEWTALQIRRALQEAADGDYDRIMFPSGDEQVYQYGTQRVRWSTRTDGAFDVEIEPQVGGDTMGHDLGAFADEQGIKRRAAIVRSPDELQRALDASDAEGVDGLGEKIWRRMQVEPEGVSTPRAEGMRKFYDEDIVPNEIAREARRVGAVAERIPSPDAQLIPTEDWGVFGTRTNEPYYARFATRAEAALYTYGHALPPGFVFKQVRHGVNRPITFDIVDEVGEVVGSGKNKSYAVRDAANVDSEFREAYREVYRPLIERGRDPLGDSYDAFGSLDFGQSRPMSEHWSIRITPQARDRILNQGQRIGGAPPAMVRGITGMAAGGATGAAVDDENPARGAAFGALAGMGAGLAPELLRAAGGQYADEIARQGEAGRLVAAVRNPKTGLTALGATHPTILNEAFKRGVDLGEDAYALRGFHETTEPGSFLDRSQAAGRLGSGGQLRAEHLEGFEAEPFRVIETSRPDRPFKIAQEFVSRGRHGVFRAVPPEMDLEFGRHMVRALGSDITNLVNPKIAMVAEEGRGVWAQTVSPNTLLALEGASRDEALRVAALYGIATGQDVEAGYRILDDAINTIDDAGRVLEDPTKRLAVVLTGDVDDIIRRLAAANIGATAERGRVVVGDFGGIGIEALDARLNRALEGADVGEPEVAALDALEVSRAGYGPLARDARTLEGLADVVEAKIGPAYREFAAQRGLDISADLSSLGEISRALRAAPGEQRWWLEAGAARVKSGAATARAVDLVPRLPVDDTVGELASKLRVKRGRVSQREVLQLAGGDEKLAKQVTRFFQARMSETLKDLPLPTADRMREMVAGGRGGASFFEVRPMVEEVLGNDDADMFLRFYAITSSGTDAAEANITLAAKAYAQWKLGLPFTGYRRATIGPMLQQATTGAVFGERKIQQMYRALMGDTNAYVHDMWMSRLFGFPEGVTAGQYRYAEQTVRSLAKELDLSIRDTQAILWSGIKRWWGDVGLGRVTDADDFPALLRSALTEQQPLRPGQKPWADRSIVGRWGSLDDATKENIRRVIAEDEAVYTATYGPRAGNVDLMMLRMLAIAGGGITGAVADEENRLRGFGLGLAAGAGVALIDVGRVRAVGPDARLIPEAVRGLVKMDDAGHLVTPAKGSRQGLELGSWWSDTTGRPLADWNAFTKAEQDQQIVQLARAERDLKLGGPGTVIGDRGGYALPGFVGAVARTGVGAAVGAAVAPEDQELLGATAGGLLFLLGGEVMAGEGHPLLRALSLRKAGLLSAFSTTGLNVASTATMVGAEALKDAPAAAWDWLISGVTGVRSKDGLSLSTLRASYDAAGEGWEAAKKIWREGESVADLAKWDQVRVTFKHELVQRLHDAVFRSLGAQDRFFHTVAAARSLQEQANVIAREAFRGRGMKEFSEFAPAFSDWREMSSWLQANPTADMALRSQVDASLAVFRNQDGLLANAAKNLRQAASDHSPEAEALFDLFLPFTTTPANVVSRVAEYSPLGFLGVSRDLIELRKIVQEGSDDLAPLFAKQRRVSDRLGRATLGTGVVMLGMWLAHKKLLSPGYPQTARERNVQRITDRPAGSIRIGSKDYPIERMAPFGPLLVMGAELYEGAKSGGRLAGILQGTNYLARNVTNESFLGDVDVALNMLSGPGELSERADDFTSDVASSFVPNILRRGLAGWDPTIREPRRPSFTEPATLVDRAATAIPGLRQEMPARVDPLGEYVSRGRGGVLGAVERIFNPFTGQVDLSDTDPLRETIEQYGASIPSVDERMPKGIERGTREYEMRSRMYGLRVRAKLEQAQQGAEFEFTIAGKRVKITWDEATPEQRRAILERAAESAKDWVTDKFKYLEDRGLYQSLP